MKQLLIFDTDKVMYQRLSQALSGFYKISTFTKISELTEYLQQFTVELLVLPVSEETLSDTFYKQIFERSKDIAAAREIPVIYLAEKANPQIEERLLQLGMENYMIMPAAAEMLYRRIENVIELHSLRKNRDFADKYQDAISFSFAELVDCRDETTGGHLKNTTQYFKILLEEAIAREEFKEILHEEDVRDLLRSAALHDIGKIGISDDVLRKTSPLDYHEYEHMKTHTTLGKEAFDNIIRETGGSRWLYLARDIAYCHHEHWDGSGYPSGLKGEEIPIYARLMAVADVYDALTQVRPYKSAYTHEEAMQIIIEGKGTLFDPSLVDLFINANERFKSVLTSRSNCTV